MDNFHEDITKLLVSLLIGSIVGAEREYRSKSAGFRTLILVCVGSTLFTIFSIRIGGSNPDRIAANIITGIGFLGAGAIFRGETGVSGLTTATMIWMSAALGMGVGAGEYTICCAATAVIVVILLIFPRFERLIDESHQNRTYKIICPFDETILSQYETMFKEFGLKQKLGKKIRRGDRIIGIWELQGSLKKHELLTHKLLLDTNIIEFEF
ncbi:MAG TPA: MgtC/SapB family protein [Bacteroidia bacterium]|jgi:putative Mg2+ transporter-C (MgtC) family protein|nr:MgtC/SapB family protein [Bacteroidia bacterium]